MDDEHKAVLKDLSPEEQAQIVERGIWDKMKTASKHIPFVRDAIAAYYAMRDDKVPMGVRVAIAVPLAYMVIPMDVIPDFIIGLGFTDDAAVWGAALGTFKSHMADRHYTSADQFLNGAEGAKASPGT